MRIVDTARSEGYSAAAGAILDNSEWISGRRLRYKLVAVKALYLTLIRASFFEEQLLRQKRGESERARRRVQRRK